jgi:hypothetical protein
VNAISGLPVGLSLAYIGTASSKKRGMVEMLIGGGFD